MTRQEAIAAGVAVPWLSIGALIATLGAFALNGGFLYPANAFKLDALGYSTATVGAVGAAGAFGYIVGSLGAPFIAVRLGLRRAAIASLLSTAVLIFAFAVIPPVLAWYPLRFLHGITTTVLFVCGETALIAVAPEAQRGRIIGFYTAVNSLFFVLGPVAVGALGFQTLFPYVLVAGIVGLLALPMAALARVTPEMPAVPWRQMVTSVSSIPALLGVVAIWGWLDGSMINLFGLYAVRRGVSASEAAFLFSLGPLGNAILQFPIGWLADHVPRRSLLAGLTVAGGVLAALMPLMDFHGLLIVPYLIVLAAVGFGTFTVALICLGDSLNGPALVAANASFGLCWGIGTFAGSAITGGLMELVGASGFPLALTLGFLLQWLAAVVLPLPARRTVGLHAGN